jgi:transcriptional regulator with XRE-family HTH domain
MKEHTVNLPYPVIDVLLKYSYDPDVIAAHIVALRNAGWTLESIANPLGMSRERVRQIANTIIDTPGALALSAAHDLEDVPTAPLRVTKASTRVKRASSPRPLPENLERMLQLQPLVRQVRANSPAYRSEAEEYTRLVNEEHAGRGVTLYRLAKELGVTHGALRFRLVRYGYKSTTSTAKVYQTIIDVNRVVVR